MIKKKARKEKRDIRHIRIKRKTFNRSLPRLSVFKSSMHIYAQVIDDAAGNTIVAASTLTPKIRDAVGKDKKKKVEVAKLVGKHVGEMCLSKGIKKIRFDRGGYPYHGRIKSLAEGAREAGLEF